MDVVLRPVNDRFLDEVVFPAFELGMVDATAALDRIREAIRDPDLDQWLWLIEENVVDGSLFSLTSPQWLEVVFRLLFSDWRRDRSGGWSVTGHHPAYAGALDATVHLGLMIEDPQYPYAEPNKARQLRRAFVDHPDPHLGLASVMAGSWFPLPEFIPAQVVATSRRGAYLPDEELAFADWTYRPASTLKEWKAQLPAKLEKLLAREEQRLRPVDVPEREEILDYWNGRAAEPPLLAVAFSGLGPAAGAWIREIGELARLVRSTAEAGQGLTSIVSKPMKAMADSGGGAEQASGG